MQFLLSNLGLIRNIFTEKNINAYIFSQLNQWEIYFVELNWIHLLS